MANRQEPFVRTNRFYLDQPLAGITQLTVTGATTHYLTRVLRLRIGAELVVFDGRGGEYAATLTNATRDSVQLEIGTHSDPQRESPLRLTLAQGVARGERMDQILQKTTELGVRTIVPLLTEHTVVRLDKGRAEKRRDHWQKIIVSACEQCGRNILPALQPLQSIDAWMTDLPDDSLRIMLQPHASVSLADIGDPPRDATVTVLIGPEGGLSQHERETATQHGFAPVSLGPRILRTETASLAILSILQSRWGDAN